MANETSLTTLATMVPAEFILREAQKEVRPFNVCVPLIYQDVLPGGEGVTYNYQKLPTTEAASVGETSDITPAARTTSERTITVATVGLASKVTDLAQTASRLGDQLTKWGASQGRAIAQKATGDVCRLFAALNGGTALGSTGVDITVANYLEAMYTLDNANAPGPKRCVLHPRQITDLFNAMSASTGTPYASLTELVREGRLPNGTPSAGFQGELFGVPLYGTTEVDTANSGNDRVGAMFVPLAMGYVEHQPIRVEYDRDASWRTTEIVVTAIYGVGELNDTFGVSIVTDA